MSKATIFIRFSKPGLHYWQTAPEHRAYLRHPHRHLFHVEVALDVEHDDREVEFHDLMDFCRDAFPGGDMGPRSCEMLARMLGMLVATRYQRECRVSVTEDDEAGATITAKPLAQEVDPA